jgi:hypothetical protein
VTNKQREQHIQKMLLDCVHFAPMSQECCGAGVRFEDVRDESQRPYRYPCKAIFGGPELPCAKREYPTREQVEAEEREYEAAFARVNACMKAIREKHGKARGLQDSMACPTGCGGTLHYSIANYNGHVHGQCSTKDCASWMQ